MRPLEIDVTRSRGTVVGGEALRTSVYGRRFSSQARRTVARCRDISTLVVREVVGAAAASTPVLLFPLTSMKVQGAGAPGSDERFLLFVVFDVDERMP